MKTVVTLTLTVILLALNKQPDFLSEQKKHERVRIAYKEKETSVKANLEKENIRFDNLNILITAYKNEQQLDLYAKNKNDQEYIKILTYNICSSSGKLGPKRKQGDMQVPEGFYYIDRFNPSSTYYLSLGINYPNISDKKKSNAAKLGGDIFIHGECVTIGCLPMTNDKIKEIYIYALQARHNGQHKIPVYIFPFKPTDENVKKFKSIHKDNQELLGFWNNLKVGHDKFKNDLQELKIAIDSSGNYIF